MTHKEEREFIRLKFNGRCAYCGNPLPNKWHVDHKIPVVRNKEFNYEKNKWVSAGFENPENDNIENKIPSCPSCNINKHSLSVDQFRSLISGFIKSLNRDSVQYKVSKRYGLIQEIDRDVEFYFEKFQNENHVPSVCKCINWHPSIKADMGKKARCSHCGKLRQTYC